MSSILLRLLLVFYFLPACDPSPAPPSTPDTIASVPLPVGPAPYALHEPGETIEARFPTPAGFERPPMESTSFGHFLRRLPLKPHGAVVKTYQGGTKPNFGIYEAVVDLEIGTRDLHQCADAVMRLRADYLWQAKRYDEIHFNFTNGFRVDYSKWRTGHRMVVKGNKTYWTLKAAPSDSYESYWKYLELIFAYAGTASLTKELVPVAPEDLAIGDVFIQGGSPGHAVIVVDLCENPKTGATQFLLAQSYMPAQDLQVLSNPNRSDGLPWYTLPKAGKLDTPEWTFELGDLKRFP